MQKGGKVIRLLLLDMAQQIEFQKRHIAYKVNIRDILSGEYVRGEGWEPSFINLGSIKVSRIDIIASVIDKAPGSESLSFVIDDGDSQILCRSFEIISNISAISIGDIIHIVGRPRDYNGERYILPEIIQKVDSPKWMLARKIELLIFGTRLYASLPEIFSSDLQKDENQSQSQVPVSIVAEEIIVEPEEVVDMPLPIVSSNVENQVLPSKRSSNPQIIVELIRKMDEGKGVDQDVVINSSKMPDCEKIIDHLLKEGEIFEIMPGKLKVLE